MKILTHLLLVFLLTTSIGCAKISPFSPKMQQRLNNTDGKIEDIRNNQNGVMLELGKIRQQQEINARDIENTQQGMINLRGMNNSGIQILSGDGGLVVFSVIIIAAMILVYYYRSKANKSEKTAGILAQQIALQEDQSLDDRVFLSALNTNVESDVYHLMVKNQTLVGRRQQN